MNIVFNCRNRTHMLVVRHIKKGVRPTGGGGGGGYLLDLFCSGIQFYLLLSPYLCFISFLYLELYTVLGDDVFHANQTSMWL